jgi:hypothetical protein
MSHEEMGARSVGRLDRGLIGSVEARGADRLGENHARESTEVGARGRDWFGSVGWVRSVAWLV